MSEAIIKDINERIAKLSETIKKLDNSDQAVAEQLRHILSQGLEVTNREKGEKSGAETSSVANPAMGFNRKDLWSTAGTIVKHAVVNPAASLKQAVGFSKDISQVVLGKFEEPNTKGDRRFKDPTWKENPLYRRYLQAYYIWQQRLQDWVDETDMSKEDSRRAKFIISLLTDALSPSNTLLNPEVIKRVFETGGTSLEKGLVHLLEDIKTNGGMPSQVKQGVFKVGDNLGLSEGSVVFRNEILELIQYKPATEKALTTPVLIIPPQINKFFVFDLTPDKSFVQFCVKSGLQTFIISWRNPLPEHRHWGLEQYILATNEAVNAVQEITASDKINLVGTCSGGITSATLAGYLAAKGDSPVNTITQLVSVLDTNIDSDITLFATDKALELVRKISEKQGVLEGKDMAKAFAWLRPNDLIWNYWVNNYLLGKEPPAFDVLYWNNDTTRLPAKLHSDFIDLYKQNPLTLPGVLKIGGQAINLKQVVCDSYAVAGINDHITLWEACYRSSQLMGGKREFILSNSGHIQSILNPPSNLKANFYTNSELSADPQLWKKGATFNKGSWWSHWQKWLCSRSGEQKPAAKELGSKQHPPMEAAPGLYVHD
ncbi:alpha/beta fold hydrolase [Spartinivicinus marinus]|nr:alpha/beta fold hydrolase [Spartinivicinus marinus]MCX4027014.1 alpha/beta fold hydrolase [Spartinivicinus marinus]